MYYLSGTSKDIFMDKKLSAALEQFGEKCYRIVKGNITDNTFEILKSGAVDGQDTEKTIRKEEGLTGLWNFYLLGGEVYHEDLADYMQYVNLEFISDFLRKYHGKEKFEIEYFDLEKQYLKYYEFYLYLIIIHHIVHMNILVLHKKSNRLILKWDDNSNIL